ncbi:hypothetical protein MNBD_GAMMA17-195 [hydrothermal vent metagenome]|uniref:Uncharacterized protein n=1 Tax=hydrothermal vent metagenome TaxID=652676 RepID=A0A3B0Z8W5_9ZZZZ
MSNPKTILERVLLDTASLFVVLASVLYCFGVFFTLGSIDGYGITEDLVVMEFRITILVGFLSLYLAPFMSPVIWGISLIGCVPAVLRKYNKQIPIYTVYIGVLFLFFFQVAACYDAGEISSREEMNDIDKTFRGEIVENFDMKQLTIQYKKQDQSAGTIMGYGLDIPGDYFVIVQQEKVIALNKNDVISITYIIEQHSTQKTPQISVK